MLPLARNDPGYRKRFKHMCRDGVLSKPDPAKDVPLSIADRPFLDELSLVLFAGWLFGGILNSAKRRVHVALVPGRQDGSGSILCIAPTASSLFAPGRLPGEPLVDDEYFRCPLDTLGAGNVPRERQVLCPVLNKIRFNLGYGDRVPAPPTLPPPSKDCCASAKADLWAFVDNTAGTQPEDYGQLLGGTVIPINADYGRLAKYLMGSSHDPTEMGKLMEEVLLWWACDAAGAAWGFPHAELVMDGERFHEIDFVVCHTNGKGLPDADNPPGDWGVWVQDQGLCSFEITLGHRKEQGGQAGPTPGLDHPKNKLINHAALVSLGYPVLHSHYLGIQAPNDVSDPTRRALRNTAGFHYWCLEDEVPDITARILNHTESPVPPMDVRAWHERFREVVVAAAAQFQKDCS